MKHTRILLAFVLFVGALSILLTINGCKKDNGVTPPGVTPITDNLFPLVPFRVFEYSGFRVDTNSVETPVPGTSAVYQATWTLLGDLQQNGTFIIKDSTTVGTPNPQPTLLQIARDSSDGSFRFRQTLGPFYRAIAARGITITYSDTLIWVLIVKPSVGVGGTWVGFDSTWSGSSPLGPVDVRLTINGVISYPVAITDSTTAHTQHNTYLSTTTRKVVIGGQTVADGAITGRFWLAKDIGPVQLNIAGDAENYGHWRVLKNKNF